RFRVRVLPERLRAELKKPLGILFPSLTEALRFLVEVKPPRVVAVGDRVSQDLSRAGVKVNLYLVDGKIERKALQPPSLPAQKTLKVRNPAGTISFEALEAIKEVLESEAGGSIVLLVEGEEDLLALPAIAYAPEGSLVFYGQPGEGVVAVKVNGEKREKALTFMEAMPVGEV
ncbi:MAG: hypothetical protein DRO52_03185, partial [Candidatus Hecatellales archaeon]